ncbi:MAG TPA: hypothetical protein VI978_01975 [Candidatus Paceibacterota bacterium]
MKRVIKYLAAFYLMEKARFFSSKEFKIKKIEYVPLEGKDGGEIPNLLEAWEVAMKKAGQFIAANHRHFHHIDKIEIYQLESWEHYPSRAESGNMMEVKPV